MRTPVLVAFLVSALVLFGALSLSWDVLPDELLFWHSGNTALTNQPCDVPITYRIGEVHPDFDLTHSELRGLAAAAVGLWDDVSDEVLFTYDPEGELVINLIYDDRQDTWDRQATARRAVNDAKDNYRRLDREHRRKARTFDDNLQAYEASASQLEETIQNYNDRIDRLNAGADDLTEDEAQALEEGLTNLQQMQQDVDQMRAELEEEQERLNEHASQVNEAGRSTEQLIAAYNRQYGSMEGFDKAIYFRQGKLRFIHIYQFDGNDDLMRVLAHELGHALGIEHSSDPSAIMYPEVTDQNRSLVELSLADQRLLQHVCRDRLP